VTVVEERVGREAGIAGVVFTVAGQSTAAGRVRVRVEHTGFANAYGADYGDRLRLVRLPGCVLSSPKLRECHTPIDLGSVNRAGAVSTLVSLPGGAASGSVGGGVVMALMSEPSSAGSTFSATSLSPTYSWSAGGQGGSFSWTYPLAVPASLGGPVPDLALRYDSGSVDGQTLAQNGQTSWVGEGWDLQLGYVERSYRPCAQDGVNTGDLCWFSPHNATLVFQGKATKLIRDSATGVWHTDDDNGLRVEQLTNPGIFNGDNDNEYWKVTTLDGTQYYFGKHNRYVGDPQSTNSVQAVPVFGDDPGEPCYNATFANAWCWQGYRWNLDYVLDVHGNSMTMFYQEFQGNYGRNNNQAVVNYDISSTLDHIDYGTRAGSEGSSPAPMQVWFTKTNRCIGGCSTAEYPDTPWDLHCTAGSCPGLQTPVYWSPYKLSNVYTQVRKADGSGYRKVNQWDLGHTYPATGDYISPAGDDTSPNLWLQTITRTGYSEDGVTTLAEPAVTFGGTALVNRVDWGDDIDVAPYMHYRLTSILNGVGGQTVSAYSGIDCPARSYKPAPGFNPFRCFPQYFKPQIAPAGWGWFHKYVVTAVTEKDLTAAGAPDETWSYTYGVGSSTDQALWGRDFNETVQLAYRTFNLWRGYADVTTTHGASGTQTVSRTVYHRGMDGDSPSNWETGDAMWEGRRSWTSASLRTPGATTLIGGGRTLCLGAIGGSTTAGAFTEVQDCTGAPAQAWKYHLDTFTFRNQVTGLCLDITNYNYNNGTQIQQWTCNGGPQQIWRFSHDGSLKNPVSGRCLNPAGWGTTPGTQVNIWDCAGNWTQKWSSRADNSLRSQQDRRCVGVAGDGLADGSPVANALCADVPAQQWIYSATGSSLRNPNSGKCVATAGGGTANGTLTELRPCDGSAGQIWTLHSDGTIRNPNSGRCLDAGTGIAVEGWHLRLWDCTGVPGQIWSGRVADPVAAQGRPRESFTLDGSTILGSTVHTYLVTQTGLRPKPIVGGQDLKAYMVRDVDTKTRTHIQATSSWRWAHSQASYDSYGLVTDTRSFGDMAITTDDACTHVDYKRNTSLHLINLPMETITTTCATTPGDSDFLAGTHIYFDNATTDTPTPTRGLPTQTKALATVAGGVKTWAPLAKAGHDANGRVTSARDALERLTTTVYAPASGAPVTSVTVTGPMGAGWTTTTTVDPGKGLPKTVTDVNGKVTTANNDPLGRLTKVWLDNRPTTATPDRQFTYTLATPSWVQTQVLGPNGNQISSYDLFDGRLRPRQTQAITEDGKRTIADVQYDGRGLVAKRSLFYNAASAPAASLVTFNDADVPRQHRYVYDTNERATAEQLYANNTLRLQTQTQYQGDRTGVIPPAGGTPTMDLVDARGLLVAKRQFFGTPFTGAYTQTSYTSDRLGRLTQVTDPAANQWTYTYDRRSRRTATTDPDAGATSSTFDDAGQMLSSTDARPVTLHFEYDNLGRRTKTRDGSVSGPVLAEWVYDTVDKGHITSTIRHVGADQYINRVTDRDDGYRPLHSELVVPNATVNGVLAGTHGWDHSYKPNGAPATTVLPAAGGLPAETLTHTYADTGHAQTATGTWSGGSRVYLSDVEYLHDGLIASRTLGSGSNRVKLTDSYDPATRRLTASTVLAEIAPGTFTERFANSYSYDDAGTITAIAGRTDAVTDQVECFRHDHLRRLTEAWTQTATSCVTPQRTGVEPYWRQWTFDTIGNRTTQTDKNPVTGDTVWTSTNGTAGRPHQLVSVTGTGPLAGPNRGFGYNTAGHLISATAPDGIVQNLTWDPEGHLTTATKASNSSTYVYDADGARLIARNPGATTLYLPDGTEIVAPAGGGPAAGTRYIAGVAVRTVTGTRWTASNHQGTSLVQIDAATLTADRRRMLPYGEPRGTNPAGWIGTKGYVGGTTDPTGFTHLGAREYDPTIGRFISIDPIMDLADPQQWHGYSYANGSPISFRDPSGLYLFEGIYGNGLRTQASGGGTSPVAQTAAKKLTGKTVSKPKFAGSTTAAEEKAARQSSLITIMKPPDPEFEGPSILITPVGEARGETLINTLPPVMCAVMAALAHGCVLGGTPYPISGTEGTKDINVLWEWDNLINHQDSGSEGGFESGDVKIYKAPQKGMTERLENQGFLPEDFPGSDNIYPDGRAYFGVGEIGKAIAQDYASRGGYDGTVLEVTIPRSVWEEHFAKHLAPYDGIPKAEVRIPNTSFHVLNQFKPRRV
jgi:RHS repeat-associated protein